jgi:hypothetical protein
MLLDALTDIGHDGIVTKSCVEALEERLVLRRVDGHEVGGRRRDAAAVLLWDGRDEGLIEKRARDGDVFVEAEVVELAKVGDQVIAADEGSRRPSASRMRLRMGPQSVVPPMGTNSVPTTLSPATR